MDSRRTNLYTASFFLLLLLMWYLVTVLRWVDPIILPSPMSVLRAYPEMIDDDRLMTDLFYTLGRVVGAVTLAAFVGIPLGLFFGYKRGIYRIVEPPLHALRSIPASALFPLFLVVIGVGEASILALAAYPSLLIIVVNAAAGAALANKRRMHQARILGLTTWQIITEFLFFEALPSIITGVRTAISYALVLVIAVEMFVGIGVYGLGRKVYIFQSTYQMPKTYAAIALTALLGISANLILNAVERRVLRWLPHIHAGT
jgi:ABC-type nitrate/sulfonate/bicarbonate transport system permease component